MLMREGMHLHCSLVHAVFGNSTCQCFIEGNGYSSTCLGTNNLSTVSVSSREPAEVVTQNKVGHSDIYVYIYITVSPGLLDTPCEEVAGEFVKVTYAVFRGSWEWNWSMIISHTNKTCQSSILIRLL